MRHLKGSGAVYVLEEDIGFWKYYKIGVSCDVNKRCKEIQYLSAGDLKIVYKLDFIDYEDAYDMESAIHRELREYKLPNRGREWYKSDLTTILNAINKLSYTESSELVFPNPPNPFYTNPPNAFYELIDPGSPPTYERLASCTH